jgi:hypothetical protein
MAKYVLGGLVATSLAGHWSQINTSSMQLLSSDRLAQQTGGVVAEWELMLCYEARALFGWSAVIAPYDSSPM